MVMTRSQGKSPEASDLPVRFRSIEPYSSPNLKRSGTPVESGSTSKRLKTDPKAPAEVNTPAKIRIDDVFASDDTPTNSNPLSTVYAQLPPPPQPGPDLNPPNEDAQVKSQALDSQTEKQSIDPLALTEDTLIQTNSMHNAADTVESVLETEHLTTDTTYIGDEIPIRHTNADIAVSRDGQDLINSVLQLTDVESDELEPEPEPQGGNQQTQQVGRQNHPPPLSPPAQEQGCTESPVPETDHPTVTFNQSERLDTSRTTPLRLSDLNDSPRNSQQQPTIPLAKLHTNPEPKTRTVQPTAPTANSLLTQSQPQSQSQLQPHPQPQSHTKPLTKPKPERQLNLQYPHHGLNPPPTRSQHSPLQTRQPQSSLSSYKHTILNSRQRTNFWGGRKVDFVRG